MLAYTAEATKVSHGAGRHFQCKTPGHEPCLEQQDFREIESAPIPEKGDHDRRKQMQPEKEAHSRDFAYVVSQEMNGGRPPTLAPS
jgi:hypothetical protein